MCVKSAGLRTCLQCLCTQHVLRVYDAQLPKTVGHFSRNIYDGSLSVFPFLFVEPLTAVMTNVNGGTERFFFTIERTYYIPLIDIVQQQGTRSYVCKSLDVYGNSCFLTVFELAAHSLPTWSGSGLVPPMVKHTLV